MKTLALAFGTVLLASPAPKPIPGARVVLFQASPSIVKAGESVELQWMVSGVESVRIEPLGQEQPPIGKLVVNPLAQTVYWLHAYNDGGGESVPVEIDILRPITTYPEAPRVPPVPPVKKEGPSALPRPQELAVRTTHPLEPSAPPEPMPKLAEVPGTTAPFVKTKGHSEKTLPAHEMAALPVEPMARPAEPAPQPAPVQKPVPGPETDLPASIRALESEIPVLASTLAQSGHWIQFAALYDTPKAQEVRQEIEKLTGHETRVFQAQDKEGRPINRLRMGPFPNRMRARGRLKEVRGKIGGLGIKPQVVSD